MSNVNRCLNVSELTQDIKTKILLKAGVKKDQINEANINDLLSDQQVIDAIKTLEEKNLRDQLDQATNLIKLNELSSALETYIDKVETQFKEKGKTLSAKKRDKIINDYILTKLDRDILLTFGEDGGLTTSSYAQMYKNDAGNILRPLAITFNKLKDSEKLELEQAIVRLIDGRDSENNSTTIQSKTVRDIYKEAYRLLGEWNDRSLELRRKSGLFIDEREDFYFHQSHEPIKMAEVGKEKWIESIIDKIDPIKTVTPDGDSAETIGLSDYLDKFYESVVNGNETKQDPFNVTSGVKFQETLRNKYNQQRLLQFKSAADALAYKQQFGKSESYIQDIFNSIESDSLTFGLASVFGTNPERNLAILQNYFKVLPESVSRQEALLSYQLGNNSYVNNGFFYNAYRFLKGYTYSKIMGGTVITSYWGDGAAMARTFKSMGLEGSIPYLFSGMRTFGDIANRAITEKVGKTRAQKLLLSQEQLTLEEMNAFSLEGIISNTSVQHRFGDDFVDNNFRTSRNETPDIVKEKQRWQKMGDAGDRLANATFKITGQTKLQRVMKDIAQSQLLNGISAYKKLSWSELKNKNIGLFEALRQYGGINEVDWNIIRNQKGVMINGKEYITGKIVRDISDINYETSVKLNQAMLAAQSLSVQEASARVKTKGKTKDSRKDSPANMFFDSMLMLKSFLMQAVPNIQNRYRYKAELALSQGKSNEAAILYGLAESASLVLSTSAAAYMIFATRALLSGTTPIDPAILFEGDEEGFGMSDRQRAAIFSILGMGGGLGILGDILLYDSSQYGKSTGDMLTGPGLSTITSGLDTAKEIAMGESTVYSLTNSLDRNLPFQNIFYLRELRRRLLIEPLLETMDEERYYDSIERRKKMLEERGNQEFFIDYRRD